MGSWSCENARRARWWRSNVPYASALKSVVVRAIPMAVIEKSGCVLGESTTTVIRSTRVEGWKMEEECSWRHESEEGMWIGSGVTGDRQRSYPIRPDRCTPRYPYSSCPLPFYGAQNQTLGNHSRHNLKVYTVRNLQMYDGMHLSAVSVSVAQRSPAAPNQAIVVATHDNVEASVIYWHGNCHGTHGYCQENNLHSAEIRRHKRALRHLDRLSTSWASINVAVRSGGGAPLYIDDNARAIVATVNGTLSTLPAAAMPATPTIFGAEEGYDNDNESED
ncbi:hypothetical protein C8R43DRAFT_961012 [Mycena crocata]|nr:hypothetical protein C8R43DRAFT_961012 [Mycena crocata]